MASVVFIGTFTGGPAACMEKASESAGLYRATFDPQSGCLEGLSLAATVEVSPSWLCWHPLLPVLYANNETFDEAESHCQAYRLVEEGLSLVPMTRLGTGGSSAAHCSVHPTGSYLAVAHHGGGSDGGGVAVFALDAQSGDLVERTQLIRHEPVHPDQTPRAHSVTWDSLGKWLLVCEKGLDKVIVYSFCNGQLSFNSDVPVTAGGGARHLAFHPDGRHFYVNEEAGAKVTVMGWDAEAGTAEPLKTLSTLPLTGGPAANVFTSECALGPSATRLYVANRLYPPAEGESIATFSVDASGGLELLAHTTVRQHPRHFSIDPTGRWMLVGALTGNRVDVYELDAQGVPQPTGSSLAVPSPTHLSWVKPGATACAT